MPSVLGCDIHVRDSGQGPPVLLLHGNPDSSLLWRDVTATLSDRWRCLAPDLPGYGRSTAAAGLDLTLDGQAAWVDALWRALDLAPPLNLVGHDIGGIAAMAFTARFPERVRRLALSNTIFHADYPWHFWARLWRWRGLGELSMALMNKPGFRAVYRRGSPGGVSQNYVDAAYGAVSADVKRHILRLYRTLVPGAFAGWEARYQQAARTVPVLVLWGDHDPYIPSRYASRLGARKVVSAPRAGHWLPVAQPNLFARELHDFFAA